MSILFIALWLAGDVFNVLGAVLQHVLPTMIILAIYYTLPDLVLLGQFFLYGDGSNPDPVHLNPSNPLSENIFEEIAHDVLGESSSETATQSSDPETGLPVKKHKRSNLKRFIEFSLIFTIIIAGIIGWYISYNPDQEPSEPDLTFDALAQFFGWLSAFLYLGSRLPQILLNFRRKSCDGISFLFFLCACLGNLTYVISILSISLDPYYLFIQSSWLTGSIGTLAMDFVIFIQFFIYSNDQDGYEELTD